LYASLIPLLAAQFLRRQARLTFFQHPDDLIFLVSAPSHRPSPHWNGLYPPTEDIFGEHVHFTEAHIDVNNSADFLLPGDARFHSATAGGIVSFEGAAFEGKARFGGATLIGNVGLQRRNDRR
jgi:hypothetical protein